MRQECRRVSVFLVAAVAATVALAFQPVPWESAKALGVTRGKPFSSGAVFVNGKYIEPPYVVERWGTGLRINAIPVSGQVIGWTEFLKTQSGVKAKAQPSAPAPVQPAQPPPAAAAPDVDASSLDDLFDDDPKPQQKAPVPAKTPAPAVRKPPAVAYVLDGDFVPNEASKALVRRINAARTEIDRMLRAGGFICFGNSYSQVAGDARTLREMLSVLPELMQHATDAQDFSQKVRAARMVYLNEVLQWDLYRNRTDYRKLKDLRKKIESDYELEKVMDAVSQPLF